MSAILIMKKKVSDDITCVEAISVFSSPDREKIGVYKFFDSHLFYEAFS